MLDRNFCNTNRGTELWQLAHVSGGTAAKVASATRSQRTCNNSMAPQAHLRVTSDPASVGRAAVDVSRLVIEDLFVGERGVRDVTPCDRRRQAHTAHTSVRLPWDRAPSIHMGVHDTHRLCE